MTYRLYVEWMFGLALLGLLIGASLTTSVSVEVPVVFSVAFLALLVLANVDRLGDTQ